MYTCVCSNKTDGYASCKNGVRWKPIHISIYAHFYIVHSWCIYSVYNHVDITYNSAQVYQINLYPVFRTLYFASTNIEVTSIVRAKRSVVFPNKTANVSSPQLRKYKGNHIIMKRTKALLASIGLEINVFFPKTFTRCAVQFSPPIWSAMSMQVQVHQPTSLRCRPSWEKSRH